MLMCFARADGKLLWRAGVIYQEREPTNGQNPYCSASPATDGRHVVACFGSPGLYCYDMEGKELWRRDLGKADSAHGSGASPVIVGDRCFVNFGPGTNAALVACDLKTGKVLWKVTPPKPAFGGFGGPRGFGPGGRGPGGRGPRGRGPGPGGGRGFPRGGPGGADDGPDDAFGRPGMFPDMDAAGGIAGSWSTPVVARVGDHDELLVCHAVQVSAYDPATGQELWRCKGLPEQVYTSPAVGEGVLVATGHLAPSGAQVMALKLGGRGDVTPTNRLWQMQLRRSCIGSPVIANGRVYLGNEQGVVTCLDLASGATRWEQRLQGKNTRRGSWSSLVLADGKLLWPNLAGEVFVLKASSQFELLATNSLPDAETTCASLAISDGQVFLRTHTTLWCFGAAGR
jgi:outer membrane protein assembly factor BamB